MSRDPGLVQVTWPVLREYIAVEVRLGIAKHKLEAKRGFDDLARVDDLMREVRALQLQSTVLETSFRECLPEGSVAEVQAVADRMANPPLGVFNSGDKPC